jgi:hypothetical protein
MTVEFTARFDDSLADYIKEIVAENVTVDLDDYVKSDDISDKISDHFSGYADPTDYFDMSDYVTEDDAITDDGVREIVEEWLSEHNVSRETMEELKATTTQLQATMQAIVTVLVSHGFVPAGWQAIPVEPKEVF